MINPDIIRHIPIFSELTDSDIDKLLKITNRKNYNKGETVFTEGSTGSAVYFILSGKIKVFRIYEDGKEHILNIFGPGEAFGEVTLFSNIPYPVSAIAHEDTCLCIIQNAPLEALIRENADIALRIIHVLSFKLSGLQQKINMLASGDVFSRTALELMHLAKEHGKREKDATRINLDISRQELAEMIGTTRETVSRVLSRFRKEKIIDDVNGHIVILSMEELNQWCGS